jgi:uncharacterized membrane protein YhdT
MSRNALERMMRLEADYVRARRWESVRRVGCLLLALVFVGACTAVIKIVWRAL